MTRDRTVGAAAQGTLALLEDGDLVVGAPPERTERPEDAERAAARDGASAAAPFEDSERP